MEASGNWLLKASEMHQVTFHWVKGHDGHPENERCNELATLGGGRRRLLVDTWWKKINPFFTKEYKNTENGLNKRNFRLLRQKPNEINYTGYDGVWQNSIRCGDREPLAGERRIRDIDRNIPSFAHRT